MNVAITRCKKALYILCHIKTLRVFRPQPLMRKGCLVNFNTKLGPGKGIWVFQYTLQGKFQQIPQTPVSWCVKYISNNVMTQELCTDLLDLFPSQEGEVWAQDC